MDGGRYRAEHRDAAGSRVLGTVEDVFPHFTALDPFAAALPAGSTGELVLVDEATGDVRARRRLDRPLGHRRADWREGRPRKAARPAPPTRG